MKYGIEENLPEEILIRKIMWKILLPLIIFILFFGVLFFFYKRSSEKQLNYSFDGVVEVVRYDVKGKPYVTIEGITYYLSYNNWNFNHCRIENGDSLFKEKGSMKIKLIKHKLGNIFIFPQ